MASDEAQQIRRGCTSLVGVKIHGENLIIVVIFQNFEGASASRSHYYVAWTLHMARYIVFMTYMTWQNMT